jgi:hypothetical protein
MCVCVCVWDGGRERHSERGGGGCTARTCGRWASHHAFTPRAHEQHKHVQRQGRSGRGMGASASRSLSLTRTRVPIAPARCPPRTPSPAPTPKLTHTHYGPSLSLSLSLVLHGSIAAERDPPAALPLPPSPAPPAAAPPPAPPPGAPAPAAAAAAAAAAPPERKGTVVALARGMTPDASPLGGGAAMNARSGAAPGARYRSRLSRWRRAASACGGTSTRLRSGRCDNSCSVRSKRGGRGCVGDSREAGSRSSSKKGWASASIGVSRSCCPTHRTTTITVRVSTKCARLARRPGRRPLW